MTEVVRLELLLLQPEVRNDPARVLGMLHGDFFEHGASGRLWDRESVSEATGGTSEPIAATNVRTRRLGNDAALVTCTSNSAGRHALRSSTWVREQSSWLLLFHHGTTVAQVRPFGVPQGDRDPVTGRTRKTGVRRGR